MPTRPVGDGSADADCHFAVGIIYCLSLSSALDGSAALTAGLDVSSALLGRLQTNEYRHPAGEFRARFRRPKGEKDGER